MLVLGVTTASLQTITAPELSGRITDQSGAPLPGVTVSVTGPGLPDGPARITDDSGRFIVRGPLQPSPATYTVTAKLAGFDTATVMVRATDGVDGPFVIQLHVGCLLEIVEVVPAFEDMVQAAEFVGVVRLDSIEYRQGRCGPVPELHATIIERVKDRRAQQSRSIRFVAPEREFAAMAGESYIAVVQWDPASRAYRVMSRFWFMSVRDGRVTWYGGEQKPLADVLAALRSIK
jgi:hypothetical protein